MDDEKMVAAASLSWTHILTQVAASLDGIADRPSAEILTLKPSLPIADLPSEQPRLLQERVEPVDASITIELERADRPSNEASEIEGVSDWMSTLDIINGMAGLAEEHKRRFAEQSLMNQAILDSLRQDLAQLKERLQAEEMRAQEIQTRADIRLQRTQADADAQVQEIRAEAETRVRTIRTEAEAWVRMADEQVRVADLRATTAEQWLQRIDAAAKNLLLGGYMNVNWGGVQEA